MNSHAGRPLPAAHDLHRLARQRVMSGVRWASPLSLVLLALVSFGATIGVTTVAPGLGGLTLAVAVAGVTLALLTPPTVAITVLATRNSIDNLAESMGREERMRVESERREYQSRLANALEMAETEEETLSAARRALRSTCPDSSVEILLADNSHAHLEQALASHPEVAAASGCTVESPNRCVAARRGQTQVFSDSEALDACPKLTGRAMGRCAAVCVPVSIMGRSVGVVHMVEPAPARPTEGVDEKLEVLADQLGARLALLRVMSETQLQADTDGLTGLANRRSFENRVRTLRRSGVEFAVVMADLDHFKDLNDTYGHEAGDRSLRVFSNILRGALRPIDIVCRYGGEEFALVLPDCTVDDALSACERIRESLALAITAGDTPMFTSSFGITESSSDLALEALMARADAALYEAKRTGRNRSVVFDEGLTVMTAAEPRERRPVS